MALPEWGARLEQWGVWPWPGAGAVLGKRVGWALRDEGRGLRTYPWPWRRAPCRRCLERRVRVGSGGAGGHPARKARCLRQPEPPGPLLSPAYPKDPKTGWVS